MSDDSNSSDYVDENFEVGEIDEKLEEEPHDIHKMACHSMYIKKINKYGSTKMLPNIMEKVPPKDRLYSAVNL